MKVKIFTESDEPTNKWGYCKTPLNERINNFIKDIEVIDIKYQSNLSGYANEYANDVADCERVLIMYEEPLAIKQKTFDWGEPESKINDFVTTHDVVKIEHFGATSDEIATVITYKEHE